MTSVLLIYPFFIPRRDRSVFRFPPLGVSYIAAGLQKAGYEKISSFVDRIIVELQKNNGFLPLTDKSSPEEIYKTFKISKKNFKAAIGALYKKRFISLEENGIRLNKL